LANDVNVGVSRDYEVLQRIGQKVDGHERLTFADGCDLYETQDVLGLGGLAEKVTVARCGPAVYYCVNRHINYTNICEMGCSFCGFSRRLGQAGGYVMAAAEVVAEALEAAVQGATEVHIVGGVNPELPYEYYLEMIEGIHKRAPELHIKAFTTVEIIDLANKAARPVAEVLAELMEAGLGSLPGGGAEILSGDYFQKACPDKPGPKQWLSVHATAHRLGLPTNATMLYGYIDKRADRIGHLMKLRELQDESLSNGKGCFQCFVPLPYLEPTDRAKKQAGGSFGNALEDLRTIAISRLMLDNVDHIKAFWPMLGVNLAQVALCFGADDLEGTVQQYKIAGKAQDNSRDSLSVDEIRRLIHEAGRKAVQRDGFYQPVGKSSQD